MFFFCAIIYNICINWEHSNNIIYATYITQSQYKAAGCAHTQNYNNVALWYVIALLD